MHACKALYYKEDASALTVHAWLCHTDLVIGSCCRIRITRMRTRQVCIQHVMHVMSATHHDPTRYACLYVVGFHIYQTWCEVTCRTTIAGHRAHACICRVLGCFWFVLTHGMQEKAHVTVRGFCLAWHFTVRGACLPALLFCYLCS